MEILTSFLIEFAAKYPWLMAALLFMGTMRMFFKPAQLAIDKFVSDTETKKDDEFWAKVKAHWAYKSVAWVIDFLGSIKLPKAEAQPQAPAN
jgi:hypothetical protein